MIVGLQPDRKGITKDNYSAKWAEFLQAREATVQWLDLLGADALEQARGCDGVMWRWAHIPADKQSAHKILYTIEHYLNVPVYPDSHTAWHYDEKTAQFYLLQALQAPLPNTWIFWEREAALEWATNKAPYPLVFKLSAGAGSSNVIKITDKAQAATLIHRAFNRGIFPNTFHPRHPSSLPGRLKTHTKAFLKRIGDSLRYQITGNYPALHPIWWRPEVAYVYFQEFVANNEFDTRVTVIGDRAFAFRRLNRPADFRASGSGRLEHNPQAIDLRCVQIAFEISKRGQFQSMAYDFLFRDNQPIITEISYTYADWAVQACPGHWDSQLNWHNGQMWPEEAQVDDFLDRIRTRKQA